MKEIIIQSRITPPKTPANIISRNEALAYISENRDKKLINIVAPAGYGKTTLVCEFLRGTEGINYAWCHINSDIKSPLTFLNYIIHSLKKLKNDFGNDISAVIEALKEDSQKLSADTTEQILLTVLNEFQEKFADDTYLVLDDLHEITASDWFGSLFIKMLSELPQNLHIIVTSRHKADYNLSHFRAKREITEIGLKELSFKQNEIRQLTDEIYSRKFSDEELSYLEQSLGGWITGIHLLIQASENTLTYEHNSGNFVPDILFDYFANEIFLKLSDEIKDFLLKTSYLEHFTSELCSHVTGLKNTGEILEYLHGKNIFIESTASVETNGAITYRYNYIQLFRTFLINKFNTSVEESIKAELMLNISHYYNSQNDIENAIGFGILSGDYFYTEKLLAVHFNSFIQEGKFELLWNWVSELCSKNESAFLLYAKGMLHKFYKGDLDAALNLIEQCLIISKDDELSTMAAISKAQLYLDKGQSVNAVKILDGLKSKKKLTLSESSRILYNLGYAYFFMGDYNKSTPYLEESASICEANNFNELLSDIYFALGNIYITSGEFILSRHYYELALTKITRIFRKFAIMGNLTILYSRSADFEKAYSYYQKTMDLHKIIKSPIFSLLAGFTKYSLYFESADYETALETAEQIKVQALEINNSKYLYLSYLFLGECSYFLGNTEKCENYYRLAYDYIDKDNESDRTTLEMFRLINNSNRNQNPEALMDVYRIFSEQNSFYDKAVCCFYMAEGYFKNNNRETSLRFLNECLIISKEKEYKSFLFRELIRSKIIFNFAIESNTEKPFVKDIFSIISRLEEQSWLCDSHRENLKNIMFKVADIRMKAFGKLEFYVSGNLVDEKKWIRKKRKLILAYLLLNPDYSAAKERIIDIFYPDTPVESLDNTFHQSVSNLRSALKQEKNTAGTKKNKEPDFILYEGKSLHLNSDYIYNSDVSDFTNLYNKAFSSEINPSQKQGFLQTAADLYQGPFIDDYYEPWVENLRDEYRNKFIKCSETLIELLQEKKDVENVYKYSNKLIENDNLNEAAYINLLNVLISEGKNAQAKSLYDKIHKVFTDETGEKPPQRLRDLAKTISA